MRFAGAVLAAGIAIPALAAAGPIDGRWAQAPGECLRSTGELDGPMRIRERRLDRYEARCDWGPMMSAGVGVWRSIGRCSAEGRETVGSFRFVRLGARLNVRTPDGLTTRYYRCPANR